MPLTVRRDFLVVLATLGLIACGADSSTMTDTDLTTLGSRYAAAWSSQNPEQLASFYSEDGSLVVNDGTPSAGRAAIAATARAYMTGFPDMVVSMDSIAATPNGANFYWTWTGTNTGPGGTGASVHLTGYEEWTLDADGFIQLSDGHYDQEEYERQVNAPADTTGD